MTNKRMFLKRCVAYEVEVSFISQPEESRSCTSPTMTNNETLVIFLGRPYRIDCRDARNGLRAWLELGAVKTH